MTDWIADAETGSSVRAKLNSLMIPISSVAISVPVEYVDIALPSGYAAYKALVYGLTFADEDGDYVAGIFSSDAGGTFHNSSGDYRYAGYTARSVGLVLVSSTDFVANLTENWLNFASIIELTIWPGAADFKATVRSRANYHRLNGGNPLTSDEITNELDSVTGAMNLLRFGGWSQLTGSSGPTLSAGSIHFFGVPTP